MGLGEHRGIAPLLAYGAVQDLDAAPWTDVGTPVLTPGQTDPFGGTDGVLVNDNDGAAVEGLQGPSTTQVVGIPLPISICMKEGSAAVSHFVLRDTTSGVDRAVFSVTWATKILALVSGVGSIGGFIDVGGGWWVALCSGSPTVTNLHALRLFGATTTASATGTTIYFVRSILVLGEALDNANAWSEPREGSSSLKGADGTEDAWVIGTDHLLQGRVRWIPSTVQDLPRVASAWNGPGGLGAGIGVGWNDFLSWGRDKQTSLWVPDRSDCTTFVESYLKDPMKGAPPLESDFTRRLDLTLRSADDTQYEGY